MNIKAVTGFQDILPERAELFTRLENAAREVFACYGYRELRLPEMEYTELFSRSIGQTTDIVEKEMFTMADSKGRAMSLRPEGTAGVVRAFIENGLFSRDPQARLYYTGAMFRHERPQKGRFRQFHQIGAEAFGSGDALLDAEIIAMMMDVIATSGVRGARLEINSVGDAESRPRYREALVGYFSPRRGDLCPDCVRRLDSNPMRLLDCKVPACKAIAANAPTMLSYLSDEAARHFADVRRFLDAAAVAYDVDERIVRGLDYYTRTAFEVTTDKLGAQSAIAGGGRYDGLVRDLGGPDLTGIGFAIGVERVVELMIQQGTESSLPVDVMIVPIGDQARLISLPVAEKLRKMKINCRISFDGKSLKSSMKQADKIGAKGALVIGEDEIGRLKKRLEVSLKDMGSQRKMSMDISFEEMETIVNQILMDVVGRLL